MQTVTNSAGINDSDFLPTAGGQLPATGGGALLDAQETSIKSNDAPTYRDFLVSGDRWATENAEKLYGRWDDEEKTTRKSQFLKCKSFAFFMIHKETREVRVAASNCGLRWCPLCIRSRRYAITQNVKHWLKSLKDPKFITFTLKHIEAPLTEQIDNLYSYFRKIRQNKYFKSRIKGGIWFFQIKKSKDGQYWHPHIHALVDGKFADQKELSRLWLKITEDSYIVDIRLIKQVDKAADYVARYAAAPCRLGAFELEDGLEIMKSLHGRRICGTWGTAKGVKLRSEPFDDADEWIQAASFYNVINSNGANPFFKALWTCWVSKAKYEGELPEPPPKIDAELQKEIERPRTFDQTFFEFMGNRL